ncbi:MAG: heavy-metal-associated domain-containing protein [Bacilli bacterium]|nr:heavy-metal-associated domain-containing protein [Bacilli bacterium]
MNKYVLKVLGMRCGMCELHVEEAISKNINVKKVKANRYKKEIVVFTELNLDQEDFHKVLDPTGYQLMTCERMAAVKHWYGWR